MKRRSGFTLIELLVVVAIIALLISILLPSLARAKAQAKKTACASNMHQLGIALNTYANEFENTLPPETSRHFANYGYATVVGTGAPATECLYLRRGYTTYRFPNGATQAGHWRELMCMDDGIIKDPRVMFCPGQSNGTWQYTKAPTSSTDPYTFLNAPFNDHSGYEYQLHLGQNPTFNAIPQGTPDNVDGRFNGAVYTKLTMLPKDLWLMSDKIYDVVSISHANNAGSNGLFGDAHVEFGQNAKVKTLTAFPLPYNAIQTYTLIYLWESSAQTSK